MVSRHGATILVVEDEPALRRTVLRILGNLGYEVFLAERGEEAVARVKLGQAIDLVITDFHLPDTDGSRLLQDLRAAGYRGGCVLTSGSEQQDVAGDRVLPEGVPFLHKPYSLAELQRVVREVLERHHEGEGEL